jgi:hypothetical protein
MKVIKIAVKKTIYVNDSQNLAFASCYYTQVSYTGSWEPLVSNTRQNGEWTETSTRQNETWRVTFFKTC